MKYFFTLSLIFLMAGCTSHPKPSNVDGVQKVPVNQFISLNPKQ